MINLITLFILIIITIIFSIKFISDSISLNRILKRLIRDNTELHNYMQEIKREKFNNDLIRLTPREKEITGLILQGKSNKVIAGELFISEKTVSSHASRIYEKLGVKCRSELFGKFNNYDGFFNRE